jgi:hypothetical protein
MIYDCRLTDSPTHPPIPTPYTYSYLYYLESYEKGRSKAACAHNNKEETRCTSLKQKVTKTDHQGKQGPSWWVSTYEYLEPSGTMVQARR